MALYLYKNGTWNWTGTSNKVTTPSLCYYQNNTINYLPLITKTGSVTFNEKKWSYTADVPTFHVIYNNTEYVVPNKVEAVMTYDIPAGSYTPGAFEDLIKSFISQNGSRKVANAFSVTVNGQTVEVPANGTLYYRVNGSSYMGGVRAVWFNSITEASAAPPLHACVTGTGFTNVKAYIVYLKDVNTAYTNTFEGYSNFRITVKTGIKFA